LLLHLLLPRFSFFPYTTLFRSEPDACVPSVTVTPTLVIAYSCSRRVRGRTSGRSARLIVDVPAGTRIMYSSPHEGVTTTPQSDEDRKSTRLNSSHVSISYAVFC